MAKVIPTCTGMTIQNKHRVLENGFSSRLYFLHYQQGVRAPCYFYQSQIIIKDIVRSIHELPLHPA